MENDDDHLENGALVMSEFLVGGYPLQVAYISPPLQSAKEGERQHLLWTRNVIMIMDTADKNNIDSDIVKVLA